MVERNGNFVLDYQPKRFNFHCLKATFCNTVTDVRHL